MWVTRAEWERVLLRLEHLEKVVDDNKVRVYYDKMWTWNGTEMTDIPLRTAHDMPVGKAVQLLIDYLELEYTFPEPSCGGFKKK